MPTIFIVESFGGKKSSQLIPNVAISRENNVRQFHEFLSYIIHSPISRHFVPNSKIGTNTALSDEYEYQFFPPIDSIFKYSIL